MRARLLHVPRGHEAEQRNGAEHDESDGDVKGVQANQRVIGGSKRFVEMVSPCVVDQAMPFRAGAVEKERTEKKCEGPQPEKAVRRPRSRNFAAKWTVKLLDSRQIV